MPVDLIQFVSIYRALKIESPSRSNQPYSPVLLFSTKDFIYSPRAASAYGKKIAETIEQGHEKCLHPVSSIADFIDRGGLKRLSRGLGAGNVEKIIEVIDSGSIYHVMEEKDYQTFVKRAEVGLMTYRKLTDLSFDVGSWLAEKGCINSKKMRKAIEGCEVGDFGGKYRPGCRIFKDISKRLVEEFGLDMRDVEGIGRVMPPVTVPYHPCPQKTFEPEMAYA